MPKRFFVFFAFSLLSFVSLPFALADEARAVGEYETAQQPAKPICGCEAPSRTIQDQNNCKVGTVKVVRSDCTGKTQKACRGSCGYEGTHKGGSGTCSFNLPCIWGIPVKVGTNEIVLAIE